MKTRPNLTRLAVAAVVIAALGAALFGVITSNERVNERRETARSVCAASGGAWVKTPKHELCVKAEVASKS